MYCIETWFGVFIVDSDVNVVDSELYPRDVDGIVRRNQVESELPDRYDAEDAPVSIEREFRERYWLEYEEKYSDLLHDVAVELAEKEVGRGLEERGEDVIRAVETLDKQDKSINLLGESIKEWGYAHQASQLDSGEEIADAIHQGDISRDSFPDQDTYQEIKRIASNIQSLIQSRSKTKDYIEREMRSFAPNISKICGEVLGARLISEAGGLKKLALMPSGTIQLLGAEKALFRHLNEGSAPPKHGFIFQHNLIKNTDYQKRGKIARTLASKIALASRIDYFSGEDKSDKLKQELEKRYQEVTKQ